MTRHEQLLATWKVRAEVLAQYGTATCAALEVLTQCSRELSAANTQEADELLTVEDATRVSGYSARRLRELVAAGQLANLGRPNAPRYRRSELPSKPRGPGPTPEAAAADFLAARGKRQRPIEPT